MKKNELVNSGNILKSILVGLFVQFFFISAFTAENGKSAGKNKILVIPFGSGGQVKMIYDRRQRPQAVFVNNKVHLVYNGGAAVDAEETYPFAITFDPETTLFSSTVQLGEKASNDHHYCPIIWADKNDFLHVLSGTHSSAGTHLISKKKADIGKSAEDWNLAPKVRHSLSYPTVYTIYENKKLMYFRTGEHRSAWTYLISDDEGVTWKSPGNNVVDLNRGGETQEENNKPGMEEWSSYQTCLPGKDGRFLHVAFCDYDDNKKSVPEKYYNPCYQTYKNLDLKYNLYYVKINLETHEVKNFEGELLKTPIDMENANAKCKIWDTGWRGTGIPPDIIIDKNDNPAFLHVLSEETPEQCNYHYVRFENGEWKQTLIAPACHKWNSSYLMMDKKGKLHACLLMDEGYFESKGKGEMNRYGGGTRIEEWISEDDGRTWTMNQTLFSDSEEYSGWRFNNIQPVNDPKGNKQEGMLLFYGWKDNEARMGKAFLLHWANK